MQLSQRPEVSALEAAKRKEELDELSTLRARLKDKEAEKLSSTKLVSEELLKLKNLVQIKDTVIESLESKMKTMSRQLEAHSASTRVGEVSSLDRTFRPG